MNNLLDLSGAPDEPMHRLMWLSGVRDRVSIELDHEFQRIYFDLRMQGRLNDALDYGLHSGTRILAYTRRENERRGRLVRWNDTRR
jgi:hypothetical protein